MRIERDPLGKKQVPRDVLYGIQTQRAKENFPISHQTLPREFFHAIATLKIATAKANAELGLLEQRKAKLITRAAKEIIRGKHDQYFVVDAFQAGMGTPTHMNVNEVIANRALELAGKRKGHYDYLHPNDDVNRGQSTNNIIPSAIQLRALEQLQTLEYELQQLHKQLAKKARQYKTILKSGRTHLQDAVPITLGQECEAHAVAIQYNRKRIKGLFPGLKQLNVGKNAIGTGINTTPQFTKLICKHLKKFTKTAWKPHPHPIYATQYSTRFVEVSQVLRLLAIDCMKLANDLRLLSSGPRTGLNELHLPEVEPGSSIMPGKINPSMAEMLNMVCYQVLGNDRTIAQAAQASQLELNVMMPVIAKNLLESLTILPNALRAFTNRCVKGIRPHRQVCQNYFERSMGLATLLNPYMGYEKAAEVAQEALKKDKRVFDIVRERRLLTEKQIRALKQKMTKPST